MLRRSNEGHPRGHVTAFAWLLLGLLVAVVVGYALGLKPLWIGALVVFLLLSLGAFAVPRNVQSLNVPPWLPNMTGDETGHDREDED
jgi:hypothetical protein